MTAPGQYHISRCYNVELLQDMATFCGCVPLFDTIRPNDSVICTPTHLQICLGGRIKADDAVVVNGKAQKDIVCPFKYLLAMSLKFILAYILVRIYQASHHRMFATLRHLELRHSCDFCAVCRVRERQRSSHTQPRHHLT